MFIVIRLIIDRLYKDNISIFVAFSIYSIPLYSLYNRENYKAIYLVIHTTRLAYL